MTLASSSSSRIAFKEQDARAFPAIRTTESFTRHSTACNCGFVRVVRAHATHYVFPYHSSVRQDTYITQKEEERAELCQAEHESRS